MGVTNIAEDRVYQENMDFLQERIGKLIQDLKKLIEKDYFEIEQWQMAKTEQHCQDIRDLDRNNWKSLSNQEIWGGPKQYYWFQTEVTIPSEYDRQCVLFELTTGLETGWDATNPQFLVYVNGVVRQGFDLNHNQLILSRQATAGDKYVITLAAYTGTTDFSLKMKGKILVCHVPTLDYYYDLRVPYEVAVLYGRDEEPYRRIILALNQSLNNIDLRRPYSDQYESSLEQAKQELKTNFYDQLTETDKATVYCVGHTHIDVAWLWPLDVTEDKAVRSFSTVLELMDDYPDYVFMSSQPQLYQYVKAKAPAVYERIKQRIEEGRWEPEGGMFVEADANLSSGESLIRQFIYGKRFFRQEFNKDNKILWLPDVFGYSAALPQIMKKCDIDYFMTTKISWNEYNRMPYDTFMWQGIDGTEVLTHFIPTRDYQTAYENGSARTSHFTTYNGLINPSQVMGGWKRYSQKYLNNEVLNSFGHGDGGGGPTREMLEQHKRLKKGIVGCPRTEMSRSLDFFRRLEANVSGKKQLPKWVGELYLEYHRGTYTSMAANKKYNRQSEFATLNLELYAAIDKILLAAVYPKQALRDNWEIILRNQFHDILPGSSIEQVYIDSAAEYEKVRATNQRLTKQALTDLANQIDAAQSSVIVFNPNQFTQDIVCFESEQPIEALQSADGKKIEVQATHDGKYIFRADNLQSKGYTSYSIAKRSSGTPNSLIVTDKSMENDWVKVQFNQQMEMEQIILKANQRSLIAAGQVANQLITYEDRPHNWDAWDINDYYTEKSWSVKEVTKVEVLEAGPIRGVLRIVRPYLDSTIEQQIMIYQDSSRIDVKTRIDWQQDHLLLRAEFPTNLHNSEATYDIQYGNVKRPTHYNTSWDKARFEVCFHKWMDLSEDNVGLSILTDSKYGGNVHDQVLGLSLLKSATYPNPTADKGEHEFTYSLYPHTGEAKTGGTIAQGYRLNNPTQAVVKQTDAGQLAAQFSFARVAAENVIIETIKQVEEGEGWIIRVYECYNRNTDTQIELGINPAQVYECDMLEQKQVPIECQAGCFQFNIKPYEIKTFMVKE